MHVFFPLLATTGAARCRQLRRFSLQFCDVLYQKRCVSNIFHINPRYFSLLSFFIMFWILHKETLFFFSTIGDDGSHQYCSDTAMLAAVLRFSLPKTLCVEHFSHKSSILFIPKLFFIMFWKSYWDSYWNSCWKALKALLKVLVKIIWKFFRKGLRQI